MKLNTAPTRAGMADATSITGACSRARAMMPARW